MNRILKKHSYEQLFKNIIETNKDLIFVVDNQGIIKYANRPCRNEAGVALNKIIGSRYNLLFCNESVKSIKKHIMKVYSSGKSLNVEGWFRTKKRKRWINNSYIPLKNENYVYGVIVISRNQTKKKEIENRLCESEYKYRYLFDSLNDAAILIDAKTFLILDANTHAQNILRMTKETIIGKSFCNYVKLKKYRECVNKLKYNKRIIELETEMLNKNNKSMFVRLNISALKMNNKRFFLCTIHDITENKWAEQALQIKERKYHQLIESLSEGLVVVNSQGCIGFINAAFTKMTGYKYSNIVNNHLKFYIKGEYNKIIGYLENSKKGLINDLECSLNTKNGKELIVRIRATPVKRNNNDLEDIIISVTDIRRQKRDEYKIHQYQVKLRKLVHELLVTEAREKHKIVDMLHDEVIQNMAIAKIKLQELHKYNKNNLMDGAINKIKQIIEESLQFTRKLLSTISPPVLSEIGFKAAVEALIVKYKIDYHIDIILLMDDRLTFLNNELKTVLYETIRELLINVIKHAQASKVVITIKRNGNEVSIVFQDNGKGFIIERRMSDNKHFGLFSIRERLEYIGGKILIESKLGIGTRVYIVAPIMEENK